jgi:hypothetical protein
MLRLLAKAIFGSPTAAADDPWAPIIDAAIEKAVDGTDPRLRALREYKRKLREPVTRAAHFAHELGERLPAPIEVSRAGFEREPGLRAFFSSVERMQEVFSTSLEVQFLREPGSRSQDSLHAALAMDLSERSVLATVRRGEQLQEEVARTLVSFDKHRVVLPAASETALRRKFKERAFTTLVACALERMATRSDRKSELEKQRALLRTKLRAVKASRSGLDSLSAPAGASSDPAALERALEDTEKELRDSVVGGDALERNLEDLCATLDRPEAHIDLTLERRRLTQMNYAAIEGDLEPADEIAFARVSVNGEPRASGVLARYPVAELKPGSVYSDKMRRALGAGP